jgi:DNA primase
VPRISPSSITDVLNRTDAIAVAGQYLELKRKGRSYVGLCPFHADKNPSLDIDPDKKVYYCRSCGAGGSIVDFVMKKEGFSFVEAVEKLAKQAGVELVYEAGSGQPDTEKRKHDEELYELYKRVAEKTFHHFLLNEKEGEPAKRYILERGITPETIERFKLGWSPRDGGFLFPFLQKKGGFSEEFLVNSGLFNPPNHPKSSFFWGRLMFPINDRRGRTIAFAGRILPQDDKGNAGKYINSRDSDIFRKKYNLYAMDLAVPEMRKAKTAVLAEGYMDVIALHQAGITNAVAPMGTAFTPEQAVLIKNNAEKVILVLDSDAAGQAAAKKGILTARKAGLDCLVCVPGSSPETKNAKDPAEILQKFGPEALKNMINCAILDFEFLLDKSKESTGDKSKAAASLFEYIDVLNDEMARDQYLGEIAYRFDIDKKAVQDDYARYAARAAKRVENYGGAVSSEKAVREEPLRKDGELNLLTAVFLNPELFKDLRSKASPDDFGNAKAKELFIVLEEWFRRGDGGGFETLFSGLGDEQLKKHIVRESSSGHYNHPEQIVHDGIERVNLNKLRKRGESIVRELGKPGISGAMREELLAEKTAIDSQLSLSGTRRKEENT